MNSLQKANLAAREYLKDLRPAVKKVLVGLDDGFFLSGINHFNVTVVADQDWGKIEEPDYGVIIPLSLFKLDITSVESLVVHYLHVMGHKKCGEFWQRVRTPRHEFLREEVDFFEEMYNQRLFEWMAPTEHVRFATCFTVYNAHRPFAYPELRMQLDTLLTRVVDPAVPQYLRKMHEELYHNNPLGPSLFSWYAKVFHLALQSTDLRELIRKYELLKTH